MKTILSTLRLLSVALLLALTACEMPETEMPDNTRAPGSDPTNNQDEDNDRDEEAKDERSTNSGLLSWPLPSSYKRVSQRFGSRWSVNDSKRHTGADISAPAGTSVYAIQDGIVGGIVGLGSDPRNGDSWGSAVLIEHDGNQWVSCYLHVSPNVGRGGRVSKGERIGRVTLDHLHFGVWDGPGGPLSVRGALPIGEDTSWRNDPPFPQLFINPLSMDFE